MLLVVNSFELHLNAFNQEIPVHGKIEIIGHCFLFIAETIIFSIKVLCNGIFDRNIISRGTQPSWKITEIPGSGWGGGGGGYDKHEDIHMKKQYNKKIYREIRLIFNFILQDFVRMQVGAVSRGPLHSRRKRTDLNITFQGDMLLCKGMRLATYLSCATGKIVVREQKIILF